MPDLPVQLLPECHADTALIRFLFPEPRLSIHTTGCSEVARTMLSSAARAYRLIGIVDNDKKLNIHCQGFFQAFELVSEQDKLIVRKHPETNQHLVIVDKAIESFLIWNATEVDLDMTEYGFDKSVKQLGIQLKTPTIETDPQYKQLLTDLYDRQAPGFVTLQRILSELIEG